MNLICQIPIFGKVPADSRYRDHAEALRELTPNILLSTFPIWLGALFQVAIIDNSGGYYNSFAKIVVQYISKGELFLYSTALLAPLFYIMLKEYKDRRHFPSSMSFAVVAISILLLCSGLFAIRHASETVSPPFGLDSDFVFYVSVVVYGTSVLLVYLAHVYRNLMDTGAPDITRKSEEDFVRRYRHEREGRDG